MIDLFFSMGVGEHNGDVGTERRPDGRRSVRAPFRVAVRATIYPPAERQSDRPKIAHILTQDLSSEGISLIYARKLCIGQRIDLEMPDRVRTAIVRRIISMEHGHYLIGCRFADG